MYKRIKDLREDNDIRQKELAERLHIHQTTYSDYERGKLNIPLQILNNLADFYNTSTDYLLGRTDEKLPYPKLKVGSKDDCGNIDGGMKM